MADESLLRVVVARRGKVRPSEFRMRPGEAGLSMFRAADPGPAAIAEAVRAAGKSGDLAVAEVPAGVLRGLGLRIVATPGGTPDPEVNDLHVEARPSIWRSVALWVRRRPVHVWFNEVVAPKLAEVAEVVEP